MGNLTGDMILGGFVSSPAFKALTSAMLLVGLVNCAPGGRSAQLTSTLNRSGAQVDQSAIIAGEVVPKNDAIYSEVVQIQQTLKYNQPLCTAIVVRQNVLLTAAHCVVQSKDNPEQIQVRVHSGSDFVWYGVQQVQVYDGYNVDELESGKDLALVFMQQDLPSLYVPATLAPLPEDVSSMTFHVAGFGRTDEPFVEQPNIDSTDASSSIKLQSKPSARNEILNKTTLQPAQGVPEQTKINLAEKVLYFTQKDSGICSGDSGGALYAKIDGKTQVVGVASFVFNQKDISQPCAGYSAFTNLSSYLIWIDSTIQAVDNKSR